MDIHKEQPDGGSQLFDEKQRVLDLPCVIFLDGQFKAKLVLQLPWSFTLSDIAAVLKRRTALTSSSDFTVHPFLGFASFSSLSEDDLVYGNEKTKEVEDHALTLTELVMCGSWKSNDSFGLLYRFQSGTAGSYDAGTSGGLTLDRLPPAYEDAVRVNFAEVVGMGEATNSGADVELLVAAAKLNHSGNELDSALGRVIAEASSGTGVSNPVAIEEPTAEPVSVVTTLLSKNGHKAEEGVVGIETESGKASGIWRTLKRRPWLILLVFIIIVACVLVPVLVLKLKRNDKQETAGNEAVNPGTGSGGNPGPKFQFGRLIRTYTEAAILMPKDPYALPIEINNGKSLYHINKGSASRRWNTATGAEENALLNIACPPPASAQNIRCGPPPCTNIQFSCTSANNQTRGGDITDWDVVNSLIGNYTALDANTVTPIKTPSGKIYATWSNTPEDASGFVVYDNFRTSRDINVKPMVNWLGASLDYKYLYVIRNTNGAAGVVQIDSSTAAIVRTYDDPRLTTTPGSYLFAAASSDDKWVFMSLGDNKVAQFSTTDRTVTRIFDTQHNVINAMFMSKNPEVLITGGGEGKLKSWNVNSGEMLAMHDTGVSIYSGSLSLDGKSAYVVVEGRGIDQIEILVG